jgi:hypothetical protein
MTTSIISPAPRPAAVAAVLARASQWTHARRKSDGRPFWFVPGNTPGAVYMADPTNCTCPSAQNRPGPCKHSLAVAAYQQRRARPAPTPRARYEDLFEACRDCGDLADGLDGRCSKCASDREWQARRGARSN